MNTILRTSDPLPITDADEFHTHGSLYGVRVPEDAYWSAAELGRLPSEHHSSVSGADYVVYSYATPIAWRDRQSGEWVVPDEHYGATTARHQRAVRRALSK